MTVTLEGIEKRLNCLLEKVQSRRLAKENGGNTNGRLPEPAGNTLILKNGLREGKTNFTVADDACHNRM